MGFFSQLGAELLPDYFLDEAEDFQAKWLSQKDGSSSSNTDTADSDTPAAMFALVRTLLSPEVVAQVNATFHFVLEGKDKGHWMLDLKNGGGSCEECGPEAEADVTLTTDSRLVVDMFRGEISPTSAFMGGKMKLKGNLVAAMQLESLMGKIKSKL